MRLIDADALEPDADYDDGEYLAYSKAQINNAPTIYNPERKKGKWERIPYSFVCGYRCSCCGQKTIDDKWNFCPNCGADMRGDAE